MAYSRYAWARFGDVSPVVPIHPQPDPGHLNPTNSTRFVARAASWQQDTAVPSLPAEMVDLDPEAAPTGRGGGPIFTPTTDPSHGVGSGHGETNEEASAIRAPWVLQDDGSVLAGHWSHTPLQDETQHPSDEAPPEMDLYSPVTVDQQYHKGIGSPHSPQSTPERVRRIKRWTDRRIDRHWWMPEMQPKYSHAGTGTPMVPAQPIGNNVTPFPVNTFFGTPDRFLHPERQTTPRPWDEQMTVDGTQNDTAVSLGSWGL